MSRRPSLSKSKRSRGPLTRRRSAVSLGPGSTSSDAAPGRHRLLQDPFRAEHDLQPLAAEALRSPRRGRRARQRGARARHEVHVARGGRPLDRAPCPRWCRAAGSGSGARASPWCTTTLPVKVISRSSREAVADCDSTSVGGPAASSIRTRTLSCSRIPEPARYSSPVAVPDSAPFLKRSGSRVKARCLSPQYLSVSVSSSKPSSVRSFTWPLNAARSSPGWYWHSSATDRERGGTALVHEGQRRPRRPCIIIVSPCSRTISRALSSILRLSSRKRRNAISPTVVPVLDHGRRRGRGRFRVPAAQAPGDERALTSSTRPRSALAGRLAGSVPDVMTRARPTPHSTAGVRERPADDGAPRARQTVFSGAACP